MQHALPVTKHAHGHLSGARCLSRLVSSTLAEPKKAPKNHKKNPHRSSAEPGRANKGDILKGEIWKSRVAVHSHMKVIFRNSTGRGNPKYHPFWGSPLFYKAPQDNFGLQNVNWHPPKCKLTPSKKGLATSNLQFLYRNTQKSPLDNLYFGGRQFAFWRLKLSWGGFIEKGGPPKRVVL